MIDDFHYKYITLNNFFIFNIILFIISLIFSHTIIKHGYLPFDKFKDTIVYCITPKVNKTRQKIHLLNKYLIAATISLIF
jgi:hypothetical protein